MKSVVDFVLLLLITENCFGSTLTSSNFEQNINLNWLNKIQGFTRCLQLINVSVNDTDRTSSGKLNFEQIINNQYSYIVRDLNDLMNQDVRRYEAKIGINAILEPYNAFIYKVCSRIIVLTERSERILKLFDNMQNGGKRFYPFTEIIIVTPTEPKLSMNHRTYVLSNALHVFWLESNYWTNGDLLAFTSIKNCLTNASVQLPLMDFRRDESRQFMADYEVHPLLSGNAKVFRVSFYYCAPYVLPDKNGQRFDGLEYRFVTELSKHWTVEELPRVKVQDSYTITTDDILADRADMAMCSIWLSLDHYKSFDLTNYFDFQCGTFLVPKPDIINAALYIYLSMSAMVWCCVAISFVVTGICLNILSRSGSRRRSSVYDDMSRSFLDVFSIVTGHGVQRFPPQSSINRLLLCWIIFSLLLGVGYSTGYTSLLSRPRFSKLIDTIDDFYEQRIRWGYVGVGNNLQDLSDSSILSYRNLAAQSELEADIEERIQKMRNRRDYGVFVKVLLNSFVANVDDMMEEALTMRLMRQCFYNHFTVFALKKHSPYTDYISAKIKRFHESGIIHHWASEIPIRNAEDMRKMFYDDNEIRTHHPLALTIDNLSGAFLLAAIGLCGSTLVFLLEYFRIADKTHCTRPKGV